MMARLASLQGWWAARAERERVILGVGAVALVVVIAYLAIWEPVKVLHQRRVVALAEARALAVRLQELAASAQGPTALASGSQRQSLLSVVDQSGKSSGVGKPPSRIQPEGDATVRVWFEDVSFDAVVGWLAGCVAGFAGASVSS